MQVSIVLQAYDTCIPNTYLHSFCLVHFHIPPRAVYSTPRANILAARPKQLCRSYYNNICRYDNFLYYTVLIQPDFVSQLVKI